MKLVLVVLIFGLLANLTSGFSWFAYRSTQTTASPTIHRTTPHVQRSGIQQTNQLQNRTNFFRQALITSNKNNTNQSPLQKGVNRLQYQVRNTTAVQRQADSINKKSSQIIPQNRSRTIVYQQQQQNRFFNRFPAFHQANRAPNDTNKQLVNGRFRPSVPVGKANTTVANDTNRRASAFVSLSRPVVADSKAQISPVAQNKTPRFSSGLLGAKTVVAGTKTSLLRRLTTKVANGNGAQNQRLLANYYYQEQLRAFRQHLNQQNTTNNRLNVKSTLRRQKREDQPKVTQPESYFPMIFARVGCSKDGK